MVRPNEPMSVRPRLTAPRMCQPGDGDDDGGDLDGDDDGGPHTCILDSQSSQKRDPGCKNIFYTLISRSPWSPCMHWSVVSGQPAVTTLHCHPWSSSGCCNRNTSSSR